MIQMASTESFSWCVHDEAGLHARPAANLARFAGTLAADIKVSSGEKCADAKSMLAVMAMGVKTGGEVVFEVSGDTAAEDCTALKSYCEANL